MKNYSILIVVIFIFSACKELDESECFNNDFSKINYFQINKEFLKPTKINLNFESDIDYEETDFPTLEIEVINPRGEVIIEESAEIIMLETSIYHEKNIKQGFWNEKDKGTLKYKIDIPEKGKYLIKFKLLKKESTKINKFVLNCCYPAA